MCYLDGRFYYPSQVAVHIVVDCRPTLTGIQTSPLKYCKHLSEFLGIELRFGVDVVITSLIDIQKSFSKESTLSENNVEHMCNLVKVLATSMRLDGTTSDYLSSKGVCVPDEHNNLREIKDLCVDDVQHIKKNKSMTYVNDKISRSDATTIGVKSKIRGALRQHSKTFRPFGQREELTSRINRILSSYQCDSGILKELIQNADDASATEVKIITDFHFHGTNSIFDECMKPMQGPALLVFNNACFNKTDLIGIQQLGIGSKGDDPTKTGQFGVGFNAVYHLTDVPSFLTKGKDVEDGETMCIMDPHCKYVPEASKEDPGMQYINLQDLRQSFPDVFTTFHEDLFSNQKCTIFRLPLRSRVFAEASDLSKKEVTQEFVSQLLQEFREEMADMLLFLNNVKKVSLCEIDNKGSLKETFKVEMELTKPNEKKKKMFLQQWKDFTKLYQEQGHSAPTSDSVYECHVKDSSGSETEWIVGQKVGFGRTILPERL